MRKDAKSQNDVKLASVQGYHQGGWTGATSESYAFMGYGKNKYFTSDRWIALDENFCKEDGSPVKGYGLEIETECYSIINQTVYANLLEKVIFPLFPADLFKMQNDGSLDGDTSAECITQVMTKEFIRNHYKDFKSMYDVYFKSFDIRCGAGTDCGMHCNISTALLGGTEKAQIETARKIFFLINNYYDLFKVAFSRENSTTWSGKFLNYSKDYCKSLDVATMRNDHGKCLNYSHFNAGRIEIRLVGGQKNYASFRNTMETIFHIVDVAKKISWNDIDNLVKWFGGCNNYVFDRLERCVNENVLSRSVLESIRPTVKQVNYI